MQILEIYDNRVLIKLHDAEKVSKGGIIIPDSVENSFPKSKATVIMIGKGHTDDKTGEFTPMSVSVGDTVILSTHLCHAENEFIIDGVKFYLVREVDLDCIIDEQDEAIKNYHESKFYKPLDKTRILFL